MTDKFHPVRRHWATKEDDSPIHCYLGMDHRVTLRELLDYFGDRHPQIDVWTIQFNFATAVWDDVPTVEELAKREAWRVHQTERQAAWERATYERLRAKFEGEAS